MNNIGTSRPLMPVLRTEGRIFPQPVDRQNVEVCIEHRWDELVRVSPRVQSRTKRLNRKGVPLLRIDGTVFVANPKHTYIRICGRYRLGKSTHALKQSPRFAGNAADQKTDSHPAPSR